MLRATILPRLYGLGRPLLHFWFRVSRGLTLGVRAIVLDGSGCVFLVRHTYVAGWHLPGGGVEVGETLVRALERELGEEAGLAPEGTPPRLHGIFFNGHVSRRDHVAVFVVRDFRTLGPKQPDREIAEAGFFSVDALPAGTTRGTRARIAEAVSGAAPATHWVGRGR